MQTFEARLEEMNNKYAKMRADFKREAELYKIERESAQAKRDDEHARFARSNRKSKRTKPRVHRENGAINRASSANQ